MARLSNQHVFIISLLIIAIAVVSIIYLTKSKSETKIVYCGADKSTPITVFKNPSEAFPSFVKEFQVKTDLSLSLFDSLSQRTIDGQTSTNYSDKVIELREKLNQENIKFENILKSSFLVYNGNPCDSTVRANYQSFIKEMGEKILEIEKLKAHITNPVSKGTKLDEGKGNSHVENGGFILINDTSDINNAIDDFKSSYFKRNK